MAVWFDHLTWNIAGLCDDFGHDVEGRRHK
jgi:hypothetical protein